MLEIFTETLDFKLRVRLNLSTESFPSIPTGGIVLLTSQITSAGFVRTDVNSVSAAETVLIID